MEQALKDYLSKSGIEYKVHIHPAVFTVEESKKIIKNYSYLHTKNLFLKDEKGRFCLVCMPADKRLNIKSLEKALGVKKLRFGSADELKAELNLAPGSVSLFGMIHAKNTFLILDEEVWKADKNGFHPNINTATLEIAHADLEKFYNSLACRKEVLKLE